MFGSEKKLWTYERHIKSAHTKFLLILPVNLSQGLWLRQTTSEKRVKMLKLPIFVAMQYTLTKVAKRQAPLQKLAIFVVMQKIGW